MPTRRQALVVAVGLVAGGTALVWLVAPATPMWLPVRVGQRVMMEIPAPVIAGGILVLGTLVWLATMRVLVRGTGTILARRGGSVTRLVRRVLPESTLWQFVTGLLLLLLVVFIIIGLLPSLYSF